MNKKKESKILKFPTNAANSERQVEAILFAAEEPLDIDSIKARLKSSFNIQKILESLQEQYQNIRFMISFVLITQISLLSDLSTI